MNKQIIIEVENGDFKLSLAGELTGIEVIGLLEYAKDFILKGGVQPSEEMEEGEQNDDV